jgi:hypothetical protein
MNDIERIKFCQKSETFRRTRDGFSAERFWSKVAITANPNKCWEWQAALFEKGYGQIRVNQRMLRANRVAWYLTHGLFSDQYILHSCDNKKCVNPNHLHEGSNQDNAREASERGLLSMGERHHKAKLTSKQVLHIRKLATSGLSDTAISKVFGVSLNSVYLIKTRRTWKHI